MEYLFQYGLFLAKTLTLLAGIGVLLVAVMTVAVRQKGRPGELQISNLSKRLEETKHTMQQQLLDKAQLKEQDKQRKHQHKAEQRAAKKGLQQAKSRMFVIDFHGSISAKEVTALRQEITAILAVAESADEVLVRLESGGGMVHSYGLAASQLQRVRDAGIPLTVAVDKVAASGGYMMACVADKVLAAPFAIVGSIGVIAQLPNFNKLLRKHDIEFEQVTAGEYKRTLTLFGENNDKGRQKFQQELEETHELFKRFVSEHRPRLDVAQVATGEHWYGQQALSLGLVDALSTSDDYLLSHHPKLDIFRVKYVVHKKLTEKLAHAATAAVEQTLLKWWQNSRFPH